MTTITGMGNEDRGQGTETIMGKFVIDAGVGLHLAKEGFIVSAPHELLAPTLFRSQTMALARGAVSRGELTAGVALKQLETVWSMKIRLLGDAVLRRTAWQIAGQLGWDTTYAAEYIALTQLQGSAFITLDTALARQVEGIVRVASVDELVTD